MPLPDGEQQRREAGRHPRLHGAPAAISSWTTAACPSAAPPQPVWPRALSWCRRSRRGQEASSPRPARRPAAVINGVPHRQRRVGVGAGREEQTIMPALPLVQASDSGVRRSGSPLSPGPARTSDAASSRCRDTRPSAARSCHRAVGHPPRLVREQGPNPGLIPFRRHRPAYWRFAVRGVADSRVRGVAGSGGRGVAGSGVGGSRIRALAGSWFGPRWLAGSGAGGRLRASLQADAQSANTIPATHPQGCVFGRRAAPRRMDRTD